jgi:hypothetical protein
MYASHLLQSNPQYATISDMILNLSFFQPLTVEITPPSDEPTTDAGRLNRQRSSFGERKAVHPLATERRFDRTLQDSRYFKIVV